MALKRLQEAMKPPGVFVQASNALQLASPAHPVNTDPSPIRTSNTPPLPTQVDADALWRAIDAAREAGCREAALQPADKKLADITAPHWWQRAQPDHSRQSNHGRAALPRSTAALALGAVPVVEAVPIQSSTRPKDGDKREAALEASRSSGAATAAPVGAEEPDIKWFPGKYVGKAWNAIFKS